MTDISWKSIFLLVFPDSSLKLYLEKSAACGFLLWSFSKTSHTPEFQNNFLKMKFVTVQNLQINKNRANFLRDIFQNVIILNLQAVVLLSLKNE